MLLEYDGNCLFPFILGSIVVEVVISAFQRIGDNFEPKELNLMSECLYQEITACLANGCLLHLSNLLSLLIAIIQIDKGCKFSGELKTSFDTKLSLL